MRSRSLLPIAGVRGRRSSSGPPLPRRWFRRPDAALRVGGAHEADEVAVGVFDNRVARPPEGVVRALLAAVAGGRQLLIQPVDLRARGDAKANHDGRCAGRVRGRAVPDLREVAAIEVEVERAGVRGGAMIRSAVFDLHTESPIEGRGRLHVAPDEVELVQSMTSRRGSTMRKCLPDARGLVTVTSIGPVEIMRVRVQGLPPNTEFDFFVIQVPNAPFGLSWYQGDIQTDDEGSASQRFIGRFNTETL